METFLQIAAIAQGVSFIFTTCVLLIKPLRDWIFGIQKQKKTEEANAKKERDSVKCLLRSEIVRIYYKYRSDCRIHSFEYENLVMLYEAYKAMGGNSFVDRIWEEISEWEIIP